MFSSLIQRSGAVYATLPHISFRASLLTYALFVVVWFSPYLLLGQVVTPKRHIEISTFDAGPFPYVNGILADRPQFADYLNIYIPDAAAFLDPNHYNWMNTWSDEFNFGIQISLRRGHGDYYFPTWMLSQFTQDPFYLVTYFTIIMHAVTGLLMMYYLRTINLHPLAGLIGGLLYLTIPPHGFWSTFSVYTATYFVLIGVIYTLHALATAPNWRVWVLLVFMVYSSVLTVYYQLVVYIVYIAVIYAAYVLFRVLHDWQSRKIYLITIASAAILGALLMSPVLIDVFLEAQISTRRPLINHSKFMPWSEVHVLLGYFVPTLFGNRPVAIVNDTQIWALAGFYLSFALTILMLIGVVRTWRRTYGWILAICVMFVLTYVPFLYEFSMTYLFLPLSSYASIYEPVSIAVYVILAAYAVDSFLSPTTQPVRSLKNFLPLVLALAILISYLWLGLAHGMQPQWWVFIFECAVIMVVLYAQQYIARPRHGGLATMLLIMTVVVTAFSVVFPLMFRQPRAVMQEYPVAITKLAPLIDDDEYMASVADQNYTEFNWKCCALRGNQSAIFDVPTIHSNTSLTSQYVAQLYETFGYTYGQFKHKFSITPTFDSANFWLMNIGAISSNKELQDPRLTFITKTGMFFIYDITPKPGCCVQVALHDIAGTDAQRVDLTAVRATIEDSIDPRVYAHQYLTRTVSYTDYYEVALEPSPTSVIIMNHFYHQHWQAQALVDGVWVTADTIPVNGSFQGVLAPAGTTMVRMHFVPFTLWMWVSHVIWGIVLIMLLLFYTNILPKLPLPQPVARLLRQ